MSGPPPGETNIAGDANVDGGGDFVAGDKNINLQLDIGKLIAALKQVLPEDDPTPKYLLDTLVSFRDYHSSLHEWKELHNFLNDVLIMFGPFTSEINRIEIMGEQPNARLLGQLWHPIAQRVSLLLEWAKSIRKIGQPFLETEQGRQGPAWAIDLCVAKERLDLLMKSHTVDSAELLDAHGEFAEKAEKHMYLADKQLRETAGELYSLSQVVLGSLSHE